jgi:hypothetical protein
MKVRAFELRAGDRFEMLGYMYIVLDITEDRIMYAPVTGLGISNGSFGRNCKQWVLRVE